MLYTSVQITKLDVNFFFLSSLKGTSIGTSPNTCLVFYEQSLILALIPLMTSLSAVFASLYPCSECIQQELKIKKH